MARREKKSIEVINGNPVEMAGSFDFEQAFNDWQTKCRSYKTSQISPKPPQDADGGTKNPKSKFVPKDLLGQVRNHVSASVARPDSPNKGDSGLYKALEEIDSELKTIKVFTQAEKQILEKFKNALESFLTHPTLNPQNIVFKRPKRYRMVDGELKITNKKKEKIFGHYIDDYFVKRYPKMKPPKGYEKWSSKFPDTAQPPLYQAIFGGDMFPKGGLIEVIESAIEQIEKPIEPVLTKINSDLLAQLPKVRSWVIKNAKRFYKDGKYNLSAFRNELNSQNFQGADTLLFRRLMTANLTGKKLSSINAKNVLAHPVPKFRIDMKTNKAMQNLIKNSYIRSPRAKAPAPKKEEIKKWFEVLS